ncbi:MAG: hypothetical protein NTX08_06120 [Sphingobacteriales bacterium]|nr:hypothetical protein [Sphingobacteriales bacterium]
MENELEIGDLVAFKADPSIKLVVTGIGKDGYVLLRYFDKAAGDFKKVELPAVCFIKTT